MPGGFEDTRVGARRGGGWFQEHGARAGGGRVAAARQTRRPGVLNASGSPPTSTPFGFNPAAPLYMLDTWRGQQGAGWGWGESVKGAHGKPLGAPRLESSQRAGRRRARSPHGACAATLSPLLASARRAHPVADKVVGGGQGPYPGLLRAVGLHVVGARHAAAAQLCGGVAKVVQRVDLRAGAAAPVAVGGQERAMGGAAPRRAGWLGHERGAAGPQGRGGGAVLRAGVAHASDARKRIRRPPPAARPSATEARARAWQPPPLCAVPWLGSVVPASTHTPLTSFE
jgi:hypothetical protein